MLLASAALVAQAPQPAPRPAPPRPKPQTPAVTTPARAERQVPFAVGETLTYDIGWAGFLTAGTATVSVREKRPSYGSTAYYITAEGQPVSFVAKLYPLYYKVDTLVDAYSLFPQRASIFSNENGHQKLKTTLFDQRRRTATYEVRSATTTTRTLRLPAEALDALSAIYVMRTLPLTPGTTLDFPVVDSGELLRLRVSVAGREAIGTASGSTNTWRVEPEIFDTQGQPTSTHKVAVWLTDDARRTPVKMTADTAFGTFSFVLRQ
jgi:hypothetical protein